MEMTINNNGTDNKQQRIWQWTAMKITINNNGMTINSHGNDNK